LEPTLYYGLKHRESNLIVTMAGPSDRLRIPSKILQIPELLGPTAERVSASVAGYTALFAGIPPSGVSFGGPPFWDPPISDIAEFKLAADVKPGTYALAIKARREWGGEALNRAATAEVQVGTATPTPFVPTTGAATLAARANPNSEKFSIGYRIDGLVMAVTVAAVRGQLPGMQQVPLDHSVGSGAGLLGPAVGSIKNARSLDSAILALSRDLPV